MAVALAQLIRSARIQEIQWQEKEITRKEALETRGAEKKYCWAACCGSDIWRTISFGSGDEVKRSRGQHGHVQRLADVASGFRTTCMMVEQAAARRKIQQNGASQNRQRTACHRPPEYSPTPAH